LQTHGLKTGEYSSYPGIPQVGLKPRGHKNLWRLKS
jgi:hypothetical protein